MIATVMTAPIPAREDTVQTVHLGFTGDDRPLCGQAGLHPLGPGWDLRDGEELCVVCEDLAATYRRTGVRP